MPSYNKTSYNKSTTRTLRGVTKRPYRSSGGYGGGSSMQVVTSGLAPLRTGGFFGERRKTQEKKTIDVDPTNFTVTSTASSALLNGTAIGTDFTDRIGRKIIMKSLYIRFFLQPQDSVTQDNQTRILIVYDRQSNGAAPIITDVLKSSSPMAQVNLNNRDRFQILWDKCWFMGASNNTATQAVSPSPNGFCGKKFKRLNHEVLYGGTTSAIASIQTGSIYIFALSDRAATDGALFSYSTRIRFADS